MKMLRFTRLGFFVYLCSKANSNNIKNCTYTLKKQPNSSEREVA